MRNCMGENVYFLYLLFLSFATVGRPCTPLRLRAGLA